MSLRSFLKVKQQKRPDAKRLMKCLRISMDLVIRRADAQAAVVPSFLDGQRSELLEGVGDVLYLHKALRTSTRLARISFREFSLIAMPWAHADAQTKSINDNADKRHCPFAHGRTVLTTLVNCFILLLLIQIIVFAVQN